jgi:signal transduction histidine kinase
MARTHGAELQAIEAAASPRVLDSGASLLVTDLAAEGDFPCSYVCVPLRFKSRVLGTLTFFGKKGRGRPYSNFDEEDQEVFESIAMLVANALAEAANYEQLVLLSEENDKKVKELSLLYSISNVMLSTIRLNKLVHLILTSLVSGSPSFFGRAMLFLINERSGFMQGMLGVTRESAENLFASRPDAGPVLEGRWDMGEEEMNRQLETDFCRQVRASRLRLNKSLNICSRAIAEKRVILVPDASREKRVDRDFVRRFAISSFAAAPLMAKEQVLGVVLVDNPGQDRPITQDDLHFLQLFTNQAGMAIENSMLYNRLEDANRSLREARERLIHGARLATIGEMAATLAHELKGPLVSIGGFARRLEKKLTQGTVESGYAVTIVREVLRLEKMLTDILSYAKKTTICYNHCSIIDILEDALSIVAPTLEEKDIRVVKDLPRKAISFLGDAQQLKQVFINLFLNSHEAMQRGGTIHLSVVPARLNGDRAISIKVADTGGGVPPEVINQIFTPFYTTKENGTGLGLPVANRIVANHGGKIQVTNSDAGAEFNVLLPLIG